MHSTDPSTRLPCSLYRQALARVGQLSGVLRRLTHPATGCVALRYRHALQVLFTRDMYTEVVTWLEYNRPQEYNIFVHPISSEYVRIPAAGQPLLTCHDGGRQSATLNVGCSARAQPICQ